MSAAALARVELGCRDLDASRQFFVETLGLLETEASADRVALRCYGERYAASLVLLRSERSGLVRLVWRGDGGNGTRPPEAVSPDGHASHEAASLELAPAPARPPRMRNQPAPLAGIGIEPRRLAHAALFVEDPAASLAWWSEQAGLAARELVEDVEGGFQVVTAGVSPHPADLVLLRRFGVGTAGALHHVAFAVDNRDELARAIDLFAEHDVPVECGPGQHGIGQLGFVYCFEPSGNRIAIVTSPLVLLDDWEPVTWPAAEAHRALHWWGAPLPQSFLEHHT